MAVKTWTQLRTAFADNNTGDITAADLRDLVDTLESHLNPTFENFTPTLQGSDSNPTVTYAVQFGRFTRINEAALHVEARIDWSGISGGSGTLRVPLPAAVGGGISAQLLTVRAQGVDFVSGRTQLVAMPVAGANYAQLYGVASTLAVSTLNVSHLSSSGSIVLSGIYRTS